MQSQAVLQVADISKINVRDSSKYKKLSEVFIGDKARVYINECDYLSTSDVKRFQENCRSFCIAAAEYAIKKLPFNDKVLMNVSQKKVSRLSVSTCTSKVSTVLPTVLRIVRSQEVPNGVRTILWSVNGSCKEVSVSEVKQG